MYLYKLTGIKTTQKVCVQRIYVITHETVVAIIINFTYIVSCIFIHPEENFSELNLRINNTFKISEFVQTLT